MNITQKFIAFLLLASVLPLLAVGVLSYHVARASIQDQATHYTAELVGNQRDYLDLHLQQVETLIANLSSVEDIVDVLAEDRGGVDSYTRLTTQARIGYILDGYTGLPGLVSIDIFTFYGAHYHVGDTLDVSNIRTDVRDRIFAQARAARGQVAWVGIEDNINGSSRARQVITAARLLSHVDLETLERRAVGVVLVNYSVDGLYEHFRQVDLGEGAYLMVIDGQRRIIYHPDRRLHGLLVSEALARRLNADHALGDTFVQTVEGQPMLVAHAHSAMSGWTVVSFVPLPTLVARADAIGAATSLALSVAFLVVVGASVVVSRQIVTPLRQLTRRFQLYQAGSPGWQAPLAARGHDEIGELSRWFNTFRESLAARGSAEAALRQSEERYALALQGAQDGIWDWDLRAGTVHYSPRWAAMLGYLPEEIGHSPDEWLGRVHADDIERVRACIDAHLVGQVPHFESEHRILHRDRVTYSWVLARGLAISDDEGRPVRLAGSLTDISARKRTEEQLRHAAHHDALTNLPNRAFLMDHLGRTLARTQRTGTPAALLFLDLDRFKIINDSLGHATGDQLLTIVAHRLSSGARPYDFIARLGGDEFAVVLSDIAGTEMAAAVASRIQRHLAAPLLLEGVQVTVQASIGIALVHAGYTRAEEILRDADTALYQAKANGRACYAVFDAAMHARTLELLRLEADLRQAVDRAQLCVHYQAIMRPSAGRITGFEALVRWQHPERGVVPPADFIPLAEETGLISAIDMWVLRQACRQVKTWRAAGCDDLTVSVNLSARDLQDPGLPQYVRGVLNDVGVDASALHLEITESAAMASVEQTIRALEDLTALGVEIAIDDFGTSYSSLGYLKRLPARTLKIDRSFIHDVTESSDAAAITSAIIAMGHILGLKVVAEGVETQGQRAFLLSHGCDAVQGYLISPALTPEEATRLLEQ